MLTMKEQLLLDALYHLNREGDDLQEKVIEETIVLHTIEGEQEAMVAAEGEEENFSPVCTIGEYEYTEAELVMIITTFFNDDLVGAFPGLPETRILGWHF